MALPITGLPPLIKLPKTIETAIIIPYNGKRIVRVPPAEPEGSMGKQNMIRRIVFRTLASLGAAALLLICFTVLSQQAEKAEEAFLMSASAQSSTKTAISRDILIDQIGYRPGEEKIAFFRGKALGDGFEVLDESGKAVYTGVLSSPQADAASGDTVAFGDLSAVSQPGVYRLRAGGEVSPSFQIGEDVHDACFKDVVRFFYLQRCGSALSKDLAGAFAHPACHTGIAAVYGSTQTKDVSGGWHDAGDYGRYVVPGAKAAADLLLAYEVNPALFGDNYHIPESGNGVPDVLDEARYELDWLLKMQDEKSGGAYHKVTCATFPGFVMPEEETAPLVLSPVSTAATGDFAAIMALAARIYKDVDPAFADTCLEAAQKAWAYLQTHPNVNGGFHNPDRVVTGEYGDGQDADERYWAACELLCTTKRAEYRNYADHLLNSQALSGLGWEDVGTYGHMAYLAAGDAGTPASIEKITALMLGEAEELLAAARSDGYRNTLGLDYPWGSTMVVANHAMHLLFSSSLSPEKAASYHQAAGQLMHYLLGANPMGYCYVSSHGTVSPLHPHHRPSGAANSAMPGMLAGGPDRGLHDPCAKSLLAGQPPAKCYVDDVQSYSTNEVAIYWNSPLVYVMAALMK
jgi:endoglucanase